MVEYRRDTTPTQDHMTSLRRNGRTNPPLLRAVRVLRGLCWRYLVFELLSLVLSTIIIQLHPSRTRRRRPLNCGYVSRACRHTGIIYTHLC